MYAGATWTRWSRLKSIDVENEGTPTLPVLGSPLATVSEELNWKDTWSYAVGAAYQLNPQWVLRAGMAIDPSPADNGDRNVRIPVGDRKTFSVGAGWSPTKDMGSRCAGHSARHLHQGRLQRQVRQQRPRSGRPADLPLLSARVR